MWCWYTTRVLRGASLRLPDSGETLMRIGAHFKGENKESILGLRSSQYVDLEGVRYAAAAIEDIDGV